ncbi:protein of unknown function [Aminobacter niigataensis]|nr:protein of unknown function [Aminobacter niigataensis]
MAHAAYDYTQFENKKRTWQGMSFYFNMLAALAKCEQNRYKFISASDSPAFIDDYGVMYHGSEFIAACRGKFGGQIQGSGRGAVADRTRLRQGLDHASRCQ